MVNLGSWVLSPVQPLELTAFSGFIGSRNLCCHLESDTNLLVVYFPLS
jgi:hypothetical protein